MKRLAIITTHPIQYNSPAFKAIATNSGIVPHVFYTRGESGKPVYDPGFGKNFEWDIPLLEGYEHTFVENVAKKPGTRSFNGIQNPDLIKAIEKWKPDAILIYGWSFKSHLACLRYFKGRIPVLFRGDSTLIDESPGLKRVLRRLLLSWIYKHIDHALYVGENNRKYFLEHGVKSAQLIYAPHAIENERFFSACRDYESKASEWRIELGIQPDDFVVLFAGKLEPKKNPLFLIELAKALPESGFRFVFVGNGLLEEELKAKAISDSRIMFLDFQNQQIMPVVYRLGNAFILPSNGPGETWGLALNEAMASGLPVIATNKVGGAVDLIRHGENGIVINPGDVNSVAQFIQRLAADTSFYSKAATASKEIIKSFDCSRLKQQLEKFMETL